MGAPYQSQSASNYNSSPPPDDGSTVAANKITWAGIKSKLADSIKTLADSINTALRAALNVSPSTTSVAYTTLVGDHLTTVEATGTFTVSLGDAATMIAQSMGYTVTVYNKGTGIISVTPVTVTDTLNGTAAGVFKLPPKTAATFTVAQSGVGYDVISTSNPQTLSAPSGLISGLTYANNGSDATNDIDIAAGVCVDATAVDTISVSAITKQSDVAWAVGTGVGGLDTGAVGNSDYYIFAIKRIDTQVTDVLFSLSSTAPTMPANYTLKRLIGWFKRVGGTIVAFHTYETEGGGLQMNWDAPTLDINLANTLTTARRTDAVKVPLNFSVTAHINATLTDAGSLFDAWICCPDQTDAAPSPTATPLANIITPVISQPAQSQLKIRTSAAGLIAARASIATVDLYAVATMGFTWARRN